MRDHHGRIDWLLITSITLTIVLLVQTSWLLRGLVSPWLSLLCMLAVVLLPWAARAFAWIIDRVAWWRLAWACARRMRRESKAFKQDMARLARVKRLEDEAREACRNLRPMG